jgi:anti-anti-sigma factor
VRRDVHPNLSIDERRGDGEVRLLLDGELDPHSAPLLLERVRGAVVWCPDGTLVLELGGVTFIDSSGIRVLIEAKQAMEAGGGRLELANATPVTRRLLQITGLDTFLAVQP